MKSWMARAIQQVGGICHKYNEPGRGQLRTIHEAGGRGYKCNEPAEGGQPRTIEEVEAEIIDHIACLTTRPNSPAPSDRSLSLCVSRKT